VKDSEDFENVEDVEAAVAGKVMRWFGFLDSSEILLPLCFISSMLTFFIWVMLIFFPSTLSSMFAFLLDGSDDNKRPASFFAGILLSFLPFILPFLAVYAIARMKHPDIEEETKIAKGMMAGYAYRSRSDKRWRVWILAGMAGALNLILVILVY
jgi:hypothetical protein